MFYRAPDGNTQSQSHVLLHAQQPREENMHILGLLGLLWFFLPTDIPGRYPPPLQFVSKRSNVFVHHHPFWDFMCLGLQRQSQTFIYVFARLFSRQQVLFLPLRWRAKGGRPLPAEMAFSGHVPIWPWGLGRVSPEPSRLFLLWQCHLQQWNTGKKRSQCCQYSRENTIPSMESKMSRSWACNLQMHSICLCLCFMAGCPCLQLAMSWSMVT